MKNKDFGKPLSRLITMVAICMLSLNAMAYDFSYTYQGKTLYYDITSSNTVCVTYYSLYNDYQNNNHVSGDVVIPSSVTNNGTTYSVTSIGDCAFVYCSSLTSVTIPNSVTSIGNEAFVYCSSLTSVTIPNSVTSISRGTFGYCSSLTSVTIPNSVTSIGEYAFSFCSSLTSVTIPNSVTSIGNSAFGYCSGLTSVTIPDSVTSIGANAFRSCSSLTSVTIGNSVTAIGNYAFADCSSLTTLNFNAENCSDFTNNAYHPFYSCPITNINIGNSVQRIPAYFAYNKNSLTSIVSNAVIPPAIDNTETFPYPNFCIVTIPCGSLGAYTAPTCYWNIFFPNRIIEGLSFDLSVAANDDSFGSVSVETQSCNVKTLTATPSICYRFASWNDGNTDNPRTVTLTSDTSFTAIFENVELSSNITAAICEGSTYVENGFNVSQAGVYTQYFQTANGCDSTVTLTLTVNPTYSLTIDATINQGETYQGLGFDVSEAGTYTQNLQSVNGCDSVIVLNLTVNSSLGDVVANTIEIALYPNPAGDYTILKVQGLKEQTKVALFDVRGRKLREFELSAGTETLRLDLRDLPSGVYTLMIGNTTKKLIVE
ncbi:MAG: leucine-rich repeat domain-containing protein [Candidatus Onthomorpha sp.]|nr:leucine-rich repeat domain-containing protein [Bacteroidales bacterium]MDY3978269.1 leucine-rich repeat domain-containing protein [Candidatus Onthomorpha sp.]MDY5799725.1 leucine-rich repeat domain-containing protein [Candidatus Onthomorpha sp.]